MTIWEDKIKEIVDFRAGCYEKGQGARHVSKYVAPLQNSLDGALSYLSASILLTFSFYYLDSALRNIKELSSLTV